MTIAKYCAAALIAVVMCMILKQNKNEFQLLCALCACVFFTVAAAASAVPGIRYVNSLFETSGFGEYAGIMMKCLGIGLTVQTTSDICRDCGESAVASKLELLGKVEILIIAVPLIKYILELTGEFL